MNTPTTKTDIAKLPLKQVPSVKALLMNDAARAQLAAVATSTMKPERMMRVVANAIRTTPKLQNCEPLSFLGALMQCAALGLEPNTILGHAYLIPFENSRKITHPDGRTEWVKIPEVQLVVGYKGLIDLARRSGHITSISANIHYADDDLWEYEEGTEATLRHRPGPQEGEKLHAYAIAKFKDGGHAYVVLPWKHVMKIRNGSQNWQTAVRNGKTDAAPWKAHEDAMAMKTAVRALAKYLPLSVEFADAMQVDEQRADYRAFAMDPTAGVTVDGEIEGEPEAQQERRAPAAVDHDQTQTITATGPAFFAADKPHETLNPIRVTADSEVVDVKPEPARETETTVQPRKSDAAADLPRGPTQLERTADMIIKELRDGGGADEIDDLYGEALNRIEAELPTQSRVIADLMNKSRR